DIGLQDERIAELWANSPLRSVEGQQLLFDAVSWRRAQRDAGNALAKAHAKPLTAGTPQGSRTPQSDLERAASSENMSEYIRLRNSGASTRLKGYPSNPRMT